jgi:hypothetical protein
VTRASQRNTRERAHGGEVSARFGLIRRIFGGTCACGPWWWRRRPGKVTLCAAGRRRVGSSRRLPRLAAGRGAYKTGGSLLAGERRNPSLVATPRPPRSIDIHAGRPGSPPLTSKSLFSSLQICARPHHACGASQFL